MPPLYWICFQLRLGSDSDLYFEVWTAGRIEKKNNKAKTLILKAFKRNTNIQIAVNDVYIHKNFYFRINRVLKTLIVHSNSETVHTLNEGTYTLDNIMKAWTFLFIFTFNR